MHPSRLFAVTLGALTLSAPDQIVPAARPLPGTAAAPAER